MSTATHRLPTPIHETGNVALGWKKPSEQDDPWLAGHETLYSSQPGGWVRLRPKPVSGRPNNPRKG